MKRTKRAVVAYSDAVQLLQDVFDTVPDDCYDSIAEAIHEFDTETSEPVRQRLYSVEKTLVDNLQSHPKLLQRFINFFPEEYQSSFDKKKRTNRVKRRTNRVQKRTNGVQKRTKEAKKGTNGVKKRPRRAADRTSVPQQPRELMSKLRTDQKLNCQKAIKLTKTIKRDVKIPLLVEKFQLSLESYNNKTIKLTNLLEEVCLLFIDNEHLLSLFIEFIVIDPQDQEGKAVLERFKEDYDQYDYTQDIEKLINHHLRYLRRLEAKVNNNSACKRVRALLALYTMEILSLEQLKKTISVSMKQEPPSAREVLNELFESLEGLKTDDRINVEELTEELEDLDASRRDYLRSVQELDTSRLESCSSSYFYLPLDYPIPKASHRTKLGDSVLQDRVFAKQRTTEKVHHKTVHENRLFVDEDEMYRISLSLGLLNSTKDKIRSKIQLIQGLSESTARDCLDENLNLKTIHLSCIRSLYGSQTETVLASVRRNPLRGLETIHESIERKIREYTRAEGSNGFLWRKGYKDNFQRSLDYTSQTFKFEEEKALSPQTLLEEAQIDLPELSPLSGFHFSGIGSFRTDPTLILDFSNRGIVDCVHWAVETALKVFYDGHDRDSRWHFWEKLIVPFLQLNRVNRSTWQALDPSGPAFRANGISRRILANGGSGSLIHTERLMGRLGKTPRSSMYCSEGLYLLFRYLDFLYKKFGVLGEALQEDSFKLRMIKDAISDFLSEKTDCDEFEETLTKLAGNDVYPLFTVRELLRKLTTQMEQLLTHPSIKLLEAHASAVLSSPQYQNLIDQGQWMDDLGYKRKLNELCPGEKLFHCVVDHRSRTMSVKGVFGETQESTDFTRTSHVQLQELRSSPHRLKQDPIFLKRSRGVVYGKISNSRGVLEEPKCLKFDDLRYDVSSGKFDYEVGTGHLMISSNRKMPDAKLTEKKSVLVAAWLRKCAAHIDSTRNRQDPSSAHGM